jgi:hypothetical protein
MRFRPRPVPHRCHSRIGPVRPRRRTGRATRITAVAGGSLVEWRAAAQVTVAAPFVLLVLDTADKIASVVGAFVGVAALAGTAGEHLLEAANTTPYRSPSSRLVRTRLSTPTYPRNGATSESRAALSRSETNARSRPHPGHDRALVQRPARPDPRRTRPIRGHRSDRPQPLPRRAAAADLGASPTPTLSEPRSAQSAQGPRGVIGRRSAARG